MAFSQDSDLDGIPDSLDSSPFINAVVVDPDGPHNLLSTLSTGLTGRWDCEQLITVGSYHGFADLAGNDHPLECRSYSMALDSAGIISNAAEFNQEADHLAAPGSILSGLSSFSISMWVKIENNYVQSKPTNIHTTFVSFNGAYDAYPEFTLSIYKGVVGSPTQKITFSRYVGTSVVTDWYAEVPQTGWIDDGRWHHVTLVKNSNNYRLFLDGVKLKDTNVSTGNWTSTATGYLCFGKPVPNGIASGNAMRGAMDRIRFYSRNLSDSEVAALYNQDSDYDGVSDVVENEDPSRSPFYWQGDTDSDDDGLSDEWEIANGLDPNDATGVNGSDGDPDADGVSNFEELQNGSNPQSGDSDGDGVSDRVEIDQGSNPNNGNDGGEAPSDPLESVTFKTGGDYATWRMEIRSLGPRDTRTLTVSSPGFDDFRTETHKLWRNNRYEITMHHTASRPQDDPPWFCWEALVDGLPTTSTFEVLPGNQLGTRNTNDVSFVLRNHWIVDNTDGLLTTHLHSEGTNVVGTRKATLIPMELRQENMPNFEGAANTTDLGADYGDEVIPPGGVAYITGQPALPQLRAEFVGAPANLNIEWKLLVESERAERGILDNRSYPATGFQTLAANQAWDIEALLAQDFVGGNCTLTYKIAGGAESTLQFYVRGKNPLDATARTHVTGHAKSASYPFAWAMVQHESRQGNRCYNQFNSGGDGPGNLEMPNYGPPDGWGIAQLDRPLGVTASTREVYNWQDNVEKFFDELDEKEAATNRFFAAVARTYPTDPDSSNPPAAFTVQGTATAYSARQLSTMILYNGAAGTQNSLLRFSDAHQAKQIFSNPWRFNPNGNPKWTFQDNQEDYAHDVISGEVDQGFQVTE